jgi:plasmid stabilization system protein ParE
VRYRVTWDADAFRTLLRAWTAANQPEAGIRAFDAIEQALSEDAETKGESRDGERRILIDPPLGVIFRARPQTGEVLILDAWMIAGRS